MAGARDLRTATCFRKLACLAIAILLCAVAGCRAREPDQLVWLSPASPCQAGDIGFGSESCFVRRKQDTVAVLKLPARYGHANNGSASGRFSAEDVVFTPTEVLTSRKSGKAWVAEIKKIREHKQTAGPGRSFVMQSVSWGWRTQTYPEGHATAMRQIASEARSPHYGSSAAFVAIESPAADFEAHVRKACVDFMPRVSSSRGQLTPSHPCEASPHFYLARRKSERSRFVDRRSSTTTRSLPLRIAGCPRISSCGTSTVRPSSWSTPTGSQGRTGGGAVEVRAPAVRSVDPVDGCQREPA